MKSWLISGLFVAALGAGACQRGPDVQKMADGALDAVALDDKVDAHFDASAKVVRLTGTVDTDEERTHAVDVVTAAVREHAQIANEVVVRGLQAEAADDLDGGIETRFKTLVDNAPELKDSDVDARVKNGVVTLTGTTASAVTKQRIEDLTAAIPGVTQVVNSLDVAAARRR